MGLVQVPATMTARSVVTLDIPGQHSAQMLLIDDQPSIPDFRTDSGVRTVRRTHALAGIRRNLRRRLFRHLSEPHRNPAITARAIRTSNFEVSAACAARNTIGPAHSAVQTFGTPEVVSDALYRQLQPITDQLNGEIIADCGHIIRSVGPTL